MAGSLRSSDSRVGAMGPVVGEYGSMGSQGVASVGGSRAAAADDDDAAVAAAAASNVECRRMLRDEGMTARRSDDVG